MALGKQAQLKVDVTIGLVLAIYILSSYLQNIYRAYLVDNQIEKLRQELVTIAEQNNQLKRSLEYLKTPAFREKSAKEQLNLKREGEEVIVLKRDGENDGTAAGNRQQPSAAVVLNKLSSPQAWLTYFFGDLRQ